MAEQSIEFENAEGVKLQGRLQLPVGQPRATALFAHCFTCAANSKAAVAISHALAANGVAVLRFDFTGLGRSDGEFADTNFSTNVADLIAAAEYLGERNMGPEIVIGHSLGGTAALAAAPAIASCKAVVTIAAPSKAEHVAHLVESGRAEIESSGEATVNLGGRPFQIKQQFLDDLQRQSGPEALRRLRVALLIMHAPRDDIVTIDNASEIFANAVHPKSFVTLDSADHLLTKESDAQYAADMIAAWSNRYVPTRPIQDNNDWVVASTAAGEFATAIDAAGHTLIADEPQSVGGTELGPSPYDLLSAGLAGCTSMTLQMYARRKNWDLAEAVTEVRHSKIHAEDCEACETSTGRIDQFERRVHVRGSLDQEQRERLMEIADRCPVHRTLTSEIRIVTSAGSE